MSAIRPKRILIDTDPGIDDAQAILLALVSPEVKLEGLTTFADFYRMSGKPANMKVALGVRGRAFIELFLERMEQLAEKIHY